MTLQLLLERSGARSAYICRGAGWGGVIVQELCESRGGRPGLSVLGIGHSLSLICQPTPDDIKHHFIIILF